MNRSEDTREDTQKGAREVSPQERQRARQALRPRGWLPVRVTIDGGRHARTYEIDRPGRGAPAVYRLINGSRRRVKDRAEVEMVLDAVVDHPRATS